MLCSMLTETDVWKKSRCGILIVMMEVHLLLKTLGTCSPFGLCNVYTMLFLISLLYSCSVYVPGCRTSSVGCIYRGPAAVYISNVIRFGRYVVYYFGHFTGKQCTIFFCSCHLLFAVVGDTIPPIDCNACSYVTCLHWSN